ncbi:MAG: histidine kinase N-terminal 7TM domain-containing protein [Sporomusaceae bacterium]|nr:histidine kinase N-terminal 7TM domain-containing protein [Sporomusaceae bacterium]
MLIQTYYPIENIKFYLLVIVLLEAMAVYTWQFRKLPGAMMASISQGCKVVWLLGIIFYSTSANLEDKLFWVITLKLAGVLLACCWPIFVWQISNQKKEVDTVTKFCGGSFLCIVLLLLSNWQELIWQKAWLEGPAVVLGWGVGHMVLMGYAFMLGIFATILSVRWIATSVGLRRRQALWYSLAVVFSWCSFILWRLEVKADIILPLGFLLNGAVVTWIYYRLHLYNSLPMAQAVAMEHVVEGIFFVDKEDYIVDINASAKQMLRDLQITIGTDFKELAVTWPPLAEVDSKAGIYMLEAQRQQSQKCSFYQLTKIPLQTLGKKSFGRIILVKDITRQKQDQAQLIEQQKAFAIVAERNRLGREFHDGSGQIWSYLLLELESLSLFMENRQIENAKKLVEKLKETLRVAHDDVRESIVSLNSGKAENNDFMATLQKYFRWYEQAYGITLVLNLPDKPLSNFISKNVEVQLMRIIQEALTNIRKHAKASQVQICMQIEAGNLVVIISDNGCGFEPVANCSIVHRGLQIMKERAEEVGGQLTIDSVLSQGTKVQIVFKAKG